jgi:pimeloyl-ACP methyl ester carboxylesterase
MHILFQNDTTDFAGISIVAASGTEGREAPVAQTISVSGIRIELIERGEGRPLLFLHPEIGIDEKSPALARLAARARVLAPVHPGFGASELPKGFDSIDDLAYFYLDFMQQLALEHVAVLGVALGGWIAAEIAIKTSERISHLVLANAVGIKVGSREERDIADIFAMTEEEFLKLAFCDPKSGHRDYKTMPEEELRSAARNREATARYGWSPFLHDPKLKARLYRIGIPTLVLWGKQDRIASEEYGRAYCAAIPGARFELIDQAGHFPHIEQPDEFADRIFTFIEE